MTRSRISPSFLRSLGFGALFSGALTLGVSDANAYKFNEYGGLDASGIYVAWAPETLPIVYYVTPYLEDSLPQARDPETNLYYQESIIAKMYENWTAAPCARISFSYAGLLPEEDARLGENTNGRVEFFFDDPLGTGDTGVNGFNVAILDTSRSEPFKTVNGKPIYALLDADTVFNNDIDWGTTEDINAGCAVEEMAIEATGTHEIGHSWGLGHSCDEGDICVDQDFLDATMYYQGGPCDTSRASVGADDIEGITALYGPFAGFRTDSPTFGSVPLPVQFTVESDDPVSIFEWNFGDGNSSDQPDPLHTYEKQGQFTVSATLGGVDASCGEWTYDFRQLGLILACDVPVPAFRVEPSLVDEGLVYQLVNETNVDTFGCIDEVSWEVLQGSTVVAAYDGWSPKIELPQEGSYTVKLYVAGPAGGADIESSFSTDDFGGCATAPHPGSGPTGRSGLGSGLAGLALVGLATLLRRRTR